MRTRWWIGGFAAAAMLAPGSARAQDVSRVYVRAAVILDSTRPATLRDSACDSTPLLNLFGCGLGSDGTPLGARARADRGAGAELAADVRIWRAVRVEGAASHQPGLDVQGNANFLNAGERQPVGASLTANVFMARGVVDLAALVRGASRVEPFVAVGIGASHNRIGGVVFDFPELPDQPSTTTTPGGRSWHRAWDAGVGVRLGLTTSAAIEVGYRYQDLGDVQTAGGPIEVVRGTRVRVIDNVAGMTMPLRAHRVYAGVRMGL